MSAPYGLTVWHKQRLVGELWRNAIGSMESRYDPKWLADNELGTNWRDCDQARK